VAPAGALRTYRELFKSYPTITAHITSLIVEGEARLPSSSSLACATPDGSVAFESRLANFLIVRGWQDYTRRHLLRLQRPAMLLSVRLCPQLGINEIIRVAIFLALGGGWE